MSRGRLIAFEGGEASGKSTQAASLAAELGAVLSREPGGTPLGERLRALLLDPDAGAVDARAEALLMAAARAQHVALVVEPALAAGRDVVTDRFVHSSLAYQGHGRGLDVDAVRDLAAWWGGLWPDAVVLLDVPPEVAAARSGGVADRLEAAGAEFHERVAEGYRKLAAAESERFIVVDGVGGIDEVAARVLGAFRAWERSTR